MSTFFEVLTSSPLLTVFMVVAFGSILGALKVGPIKLGAAGALFVGLAFGALHPALGQNLELIETLGLALFVYTVGLAAGTGFFSELRQQAPLILLGTVVLGIVALSGRLVGNLIGLNLAEQAGAYAGAMTATAGVSAAAIASGNPQAVNVGYAMSYPIGVVLSIFAVLLVINSQWPAKKDPRPESADGLVALSARVLRDTRVNEIPGYAKGLVRFSYLQRGTRKRVYIPGEELLEGDIVLTVGARSHVESAISHIGIKDNSVLTHDRSMVDHKRMLVSNDDVVGREISSLELGERFGAVITRVRRGDRDLLATGATILERGDRVLAVAPNDQIDALASLLGNSERKVSEIDAISLGIGMTLGLLVGMISLHFGSSVSLSLGAAAGPLLVGMILGHFERTGPLVWGMPLHANLIIRQLGLLFFLAAIGLSSGQDFARVAFTQKGIQVGALAFSLVAIGSILYFVGARLLGFSVARACGGLAGYMGQPAILAFANSRIDDERIDAGYASLFALAMILKVLIIQIMAI